MIEVGTDLLKKYREVRQQSLHLCEPLKAEDYVVQPIVDVSPPKWHLAHTTWFFEEFVLNLYKKGYKILDPDYAYMFNSYYNNVGDRVLRPNRGFMTRPTTDQIFEYRKYVDEHMMELLEEDLDPELAATVELGLNHEQQHQELLVTDLKYILGNNPLFPVYDRDPKVVDWTGETGSENYVTIEEGTYQIGYDGNGFHFDNEKGVHKVFLHSFEILDRLITNGDYLEFIESGAYDNFNLWLSEGWDWVQSLETKAPFYWHQFEGKWHYYTLQGFQEVDPAQPLTHISYYEAEAFARWKNRRLPTEFEWEAASNSILQGNSDSGNFVDDQFYRTIPRKGNSNQMMGDVWEWTSSSYSAYPYFKTVEGAIGEYNGKFMVNQMVLRGGSCATPRNHIRNTYRNFWHPHLRWQFTGLRLAQNI